MQPRMPPAMIPLTIGRTLLPELKNPEIGCRTSGVSEDLPVNIQGSKQSKDHQGISQDETEDQTDEFS
jgi:hypothetical protein